MNRRITVEQADSSDSCENVTFLEIAVRAANETYFVIFDNIRTSLEIVLIVSFVFVLVFVNKYCSKDYKNFVEFNGVLSRSSFLIEFSFQSDHKTLIFL